MGGIRRRGGAGGPAIALAALALLASGAGAATFDYVIVSAFESDPDLPRFAHTFATFVRATGQGTCPDGYTLEAHTISWYPASGEIRAARFCPERGVNLNVAA